MSDFDDAFNRANQPPAAPPPPALPPGRPMVPAGCSAVLAIAGGVLLLVILLGVAATVKDAIWPPSDAELARRARRAAEDRNPSAYNAATRIVRRSLKAPATAEFQSYSSELVRYGNGRYLVRGWVDAENSFGAKLRSTWACDLTLTGETFRGDCEVLK